MCTWLQWKTNRKLYVPCQITPLLVTLRSFLLFESFLAPYLGNIGCIICNMFISTDIMRRVVFTRWRSFLLTDRETERKTSRQADRDTSDPYWGEV